LDSKTRPLSLPRPSCVLLPLAALAVLGSAASPGVEVRKLSLAPTPGGDVLRFRVGPDGMHVAYVGDLEIDSRPELFVVGTAPGAPHLALNPPLVAGGGVGTTTFCFTPDGSRVLFTADVDVRDHNDLYSAPVDGSAAAVRLNDPVDESSSHPQIVGFTDDGRAVFLASDIASEVQELYAAPVDGSSPAQRLNADIGDPIFSPYVLTHGVTEAVLLADGERVLYRVGATTAAGYFVAPLDGSQAASALGDLGTWKLANDTVVYRRTIFLHGLRLDGSPPTLLPTSPVLGDFAVDPSGEHVLYSTDTVLSRIPVDGGRSPVSLTPPAAGGGHAILPHPDGRRVLYTAAQESAGVVELWVTAPGPRSARAPGPTGDATIDARGVNGPATIRLNLPLDPGEAVLTNDTQASPRFWLTPDGRTVLFYQSRAEGGAEVYAVDSRGASPAVRLSGEVPPNGTVTHHLPSTFGTSSTYPRISADGRRVVFGAGTSSAVVELYEAPIAGGAVPRRVSGDLVAGGDVLDPIGSLAFELTPAGDAVVYVADQEQDGVHELFLSELPPLP
jgi:Tol biopolymer transport system component